MKASLKKRGDYEQVNKHNLLENLSAKDQHPIQAIVDLEGNLVDINKQLKEVAHKIEYGDIGGNLGFVTRPRYIRSVKYNEKNLIIQETYEGDMSKIIDYSYDVNDLLISKKVTREDGKSFVSSFQYNEDGLLISENNEGTEEHHIYTSGGVALYLTRRMHVGSSTDTLVCDVEYEFGANHMGTILGIEMIARNTGSTTSAFSIKRYGHEITSASINSFDTQKYFLGISKSISVYARGNLDIEVNISYIKNDDAILGDNPDLITMVSNIGEEVSRLSFRYDNILSSVHNTADSFTDLMIDNNNVLTSVRDGEVI